MIFTQNTMTHAYGCLRLVVSLLILYVSEEKNQQKLKSPILLSEITTVSVPL